MTTSVPQTKANTGRLISLDAMRGFVMAAMILVNYPGSSEHIFLPLEHAEWDGLTPTDLIFPFFLFMVGISISLSYSKQLSAGGHGWNVYKKILFRSLKIFAVGLFLSMLPTFDIFNIRITGVLQRISIVFLFCSVLYLNTSFYQQIWIAAIVLIAYWLVMTLIPTPGVGYVAWERGLNLAAWVDSKLLPGKMWQGTWDPEGILTTITSIATGITGLLAGHLILSTRTGTEKIMLLMIAGFISVTFGYVWGLTFPVNKNLWTSSYVLVTSGLACLTLGTMYYLVDIRGLKSWAKPGIIFGSNAIAIYFISDCISYLLYWLPVGSAPINEQFVTALINSGVYPKIASVTFAAIFVMINFLIALFLYKRKIFIKL